MGCLNTANAAPCDDKNPCTVKDRCVSQTCGGQVKNCDDGKPCTHDHCDGKTGKCAATTFKGPCDDGKPCTINDTCHNNWSGLVSLAIATTATPAQRTRAPRREGVRPWRFRTA